ncbi:MAG: TetR/AcrR family transcriptional regulator [Pricia sp.]|nr:TetR/AcrR family transcriptional regulator [Pricia sp.]
MRLRDDTKIETIFKATISLTGEVGLDKLTMSAIAKRADIAIGTLYIYFEGKDQLLNALYKELILKGTLSLLPSIAHLPLKKQLFTIWANVLKFRIDNSSQVAFMHQFRYSSIISDEAKNLDEQFVKHVSELLEAGKSEFIVKDIDNDLLFPLLYGYVNNLARHLVEKNIKLSEKIIDQTFGICWDAIKA